MNELITATIIANEAYIAINNYNFFFFLTGSNCKTTKRRLMAYIPQEALWSCTDMRNISEHVINISYLLRFEFMSTSYTLIHTHTIYDRSLHRMVS